ncbi:TPA: hypothetical protein ACGU4U_002829, partial [Vibrio vulnificus]
TNTLKVYQDNTHFWHFNSLHKSGANIYKPQPNLNNTVTINNINVTGDKKHMPTIYQNNNNHSFQRD